MRIVSLAGWLLLALPATATADLTSAPENTNPEIYIGPDVGRGNPVLIDTLGEQDTVFRAWGSPGTKSKPSKWSAKLEFAVQFDDIASDDVVMVQVNKGKRKLGKPVACSPKNVISGAKLALFECQAPKGRDYAKMFDSKGEHIIKLSYKKIVEGKLFTDFATLKVHPTELKQGSSNNPYRAWSEDHDMKLWVSSVEEKTENGGSGPAAAAKNAVAAAMREGIPYMIAHTWFKRYERPERTKMVCLFGGKRVAEADDVSNQKYDYWTYKRKGNPERNQPRWHQAEYFLYALHPRPKADGSKGSYAKPQHWMHENPGPYKCVVTGGGEILKELHFTVGEDGEIVKPACQLESMNTLRSVTLVKTINKRLSDGKFNKRVGKKFGYEGRVKWAKGCPP